MKQIITVFCTLFLSGYMFGQNVIEEKFKNYKEQDNFTKVHITAKAFELSGYIELDSEDEDMKEFREFLKTVKSFDLIAGKEVVDAGNKYLTAVKKMEGSHEELMEVADQDGNFTFFVDESHGVVHELAVVGHKEDHLVIFSLTGTMDMKQISKMAKHMHTEGPNQLRKMFDNGMQEIRVYPNPLDKSEALNIQVPTEMTGGTVKLLNLNGAVVKTIQLQNTSEKLDTSNLPAGNYILEFNSENISVKKKIVIR